MSLEFVRPQLATAVDHPPPRAGWIHEVKHDGYRTLLVIERRKARSYTRNDFDWTDRYPSITKAAARLGTALPLSRARSLFRMSVVSQISSQHREAANFPSGQPSCRGFGARAAIVAFLKRRRNVCSNGPFVMDASPNFVLHPPSLA